MQVDITPGKYVLAVSGGVDSMVLLDILRQRSDIDLVVAHFNHGIRTDAKRDEELVRQTANKYDLLFESGHGRLGAKTSEDQARQARYNFLESIKKKHKADGIITAHHQDDLLETAFLNILRGTGRAGLSAIRNPKIQRPLLGITKKKLLKYAKKRKLAWREDKTNKDSRYLRNYLRLHVIPSLSGVQRAKMLQNLDKVAKINQIIDDEITAISRKIVDGNLDRAKFTMLPTSVAEEVLMRWLRRSDLGQFDRQTIKRLASAIKTGRVNSTQPIYKNAQLVIGSQKVSLEHL